MIPASVLDNVVPWILQVLVIGSLGAVLPLMFRIRHPRSQLIYCHLLLAACFALPVIQPWRHPVITAEVGQNVIDAPAIVLPKTMTGGAVSTAPISWHQMAVLIFLAGVAIRLCSTLAGLWELRRYRKSAAPLYALPEPVRAARSIVKADADFFTTAGAGPLTFGFFRRMILLPKSFQDLNEQAQLGIACHELLHVRRNDWLVTLLEELAASLFWFHPAIWWVLAQTRLAREQLVDAEVVRLTSAREPYINALLEIAGARPTLDLAPAPLFLRKRHLFQRMHFLLSEVSMTRFRLFSSYGSMVAILVLAGWVVLVSFPLIGKAEIKPAVRQSPSQTSQPQPGYVVNTPPVYYPPAALQKGIQGSVVVELTFNASGDVTDSRVLSGPEELRKGGLESALRGTYNINTARTLQVVVNFTIPPTVAGTPGQRGNFQVRDGAPVTLPGARGGAPIQAFPGPPPAPADIARGIFEKMGNVEGIDVIGLQGSDLAQMQQRLQRFQGQPMSKDLFDQITEAALSGGVSVPYQGLNIQPTPNQGSRVQVTFSATPLRVRVGGRVADNNLIKPAAEPVYPPLAKVSKVQGDVVLEVNITKEGKVENLTVVSGHPLLTDAAIDAVRQWGYKPTLLNGAPVDVVTTVTVNFTLPQQ
jgi:TonB family protein